VAYERVNPTYMCDDSEAAIQQAVSNFFFNFLKFILR